MGTVAGHAVFGYRFVFPEEGTAFLGMAPVAGLIQCHGLQRPGAVRTVRVVAVGTGQQALADRVNRCLVHIRAYLPVAGRADVALLFLAQHAIWLMDQVAAGTGQVGRLVGAALPVQATGILVTTEATRILLVRGYPGILAVQDKTGEILAFGRRMDFTRTVAGFTTLFGERGAQVIHLRMFRWQDLLEFVLVAFGADVGADEFAPGLCRGRWVGSEGGQRQAEKNDDHDETKHRETPGDIQIV